MLTPGVKNLCDGASVTAVIATVAGWLPDIAAALTVVWAVFRIYEVYLSIRLAKNKLKERNEQGSK